MTVTRPAVLLLSVLASTAAAYVNTQYGFSAIAPSGWTQQSVPGTLVAFTGPVQGQFAPNLNVVVTKLPANITLKQLETAGRQQLEQTITDFKFLGRSDTRLGNLPAVQQRFNGRQGKFDLTFIQTFAVKGTSAYVVTATTGRTGTSSLAGINAAFVKSFKFSK